MGRLGRLSGEWKENVRTDTGVVLERLIKAMRWFDVEGMSLLFKGKKKFCLIFRPFSNHLPGLSWQLVPSTGSAEKEETEGRKGKYRNSVFWCKGGMERRGVEWLRKEGRQRESSGGTWRSRRKKKQCRCSHRHVVHQITFGRVCMDGYVIIIIIKFSRKVF